ncbi:peptidase family C54 [Lipomyces oligophaga]|uniref:peptidase family C54 n=1 Tax=Lipomyces oligophaga TaxID=45792 RepID=UPI0034CFC341
MQRLAELLLVKGDSANNDHENPIIWTGGRLFNAVPDSESDSDLESDSESTPRSNSRSKLDSDEVALDQQDGADLDRRERLNYRKVETAMMVTSTTSEKVAIAKSRITNWFSGLTTDQDSINLDEGNESSGVHINVIGGTKWPREFSRCVEELVYLSYRTDFPAIKPVEGGPMPKNVSSLFGLESSGFTSDVGWGCMIRSGQTLLANALLRVIPLDDVDRRKEAVSWFADDPGAPFSIHRFVHYGYISCGKAPGQWFGPSAVARCIKILCGQFPKCGLRVYVGGDAGDVYRENLMEIATNSGAELFTPTLVLLGMKLGIEKITPVYYDALKYVLALPQSVGIAGGRPSAAHYFYAYQNDNLFYLDPHFPRKALPYYSNVQEYNSSDFNSVHSNRIRYIGLQGMDPSMLIGFVITKMDDCNQWTHSLDDFQGRKFIHVSEKEPVYDNISF